MPRFGSDRQYVSNNLSSNTDAGGNAIISPDNGFGGSPLGPAAIAQSLYAIANPLFNLTPPDVLSAIAPDNQVPYWQFSNFSNSMSGSMFFDSTAQTWAVRLNPGTASAGEYITLKTRSYLINDTNLNLRQKALATVTKVGTYSSTNQWNLVLTASYYDVTGAQLHSYAIGTVADNGTWSSITGNTTSGGTAIAAAAAYVDLDFTLTAAATVSGTAKVDIESLLLATSTTATGAFLVTQTFTANGTFTRPTGVNYVSVAAIGGGGGGAGGVVYTSRINSRGVDISYPGNGGNWFLAKDVYVGDLSTVSVGIAAGGAGGTAASYSKAAAGTGLATNSVYGGNGATGGATTFGSLFTVNGGGGGIGTSGLQGPGTLGANATTIIYGGVNAIGGTATNNITTGVGGLSPYTIVPYTTGAGTGSIGGTGSSTAVTNGLGTVGVGGTSTAGWIGAGGGCGAADSSPGGGGGSGTPSAGTAFAGAYGGGGGGASRAVFFNALLGSVTGTAGVGGAGAANTGAGGGGGGGYALSASSTAIHTSAAYNLTAGTGGAGASGVITIAWVA